MRLDEIERMDINWLRSAHLDFRDDGPVNKGAKTHVFSVFSRANHSLLGYVKWFGNWRKYCFYPLNSLFDGHCLRQIAQFCDEASAIHKARLPKTLKYEKDKALRARQRRIDELAKKKLTSGLNSDTIGLEVEKETFPDENRVVEGDHD